MRDRLNPFHPRCATGYTLIAIGLVALGACFHRPSPGLLAFALLFIAGPVLILVSLRHVARSIAIERRAPVSAFEGDAIEIGFKIFNRSRWSMFFPSLCDVFAPELHDQKLVTYPGRVNGGEIVQQRYEGHCLLPRGIYRLGPTAVRVSDPFGFFEVTREFQAAPELKVYPRVIPTSVERLIGRSITALDMDRTRNTTGDSNEFFGVREYQFGDSPRRIHWRLTAHTGTPVVKEYTPTSTGNLCWLLDLNRNSLVGWGRNSSLEYQVKMAASVLAQALKQGRRVELFAGVGADDEIPAAAGANQIQRILDLLVGVSLSAKHPTLPEVLRAVGTRISSGATIVLAATPYLYEDDDFWAQLARHRNRGHRIIVLVFDGYSFRRLKDSEDQGPIPAGRQRWRWDDTDFSRVDERAIRADLFALRLRNAGYVAHVIRSGARLGHVLKGGLG